MKILDHDFFSISFDSVVIDQIIPYDLYINSSTVELHEKFVHIYPKDDFITNEILIDFKKKYHQLYVHETQREFYLKSLVGSNLIPDLKKTEIIKDSAIHYLDKLFDKNKEFSTEILSKTLKDCKNTVESMVEVIKDYDVSSLQTLIANLSFHDFYTYDHSINVSMYCIALYSTAFPHAPKEEIVMAGLGGFLHDIGKIKLPTEIINNPDELTAEEYEIIKKHPDDGFHLLEENPCICEGVDFEIVKRIVHEHHENVNGTGYPKKLSSPDIHILAKVTAIADFFDAVTTKRTYSEVLSTEEAIELMKKSVGKKLDPDLFELFSAGVKKITNSKFGHKELPDNFDPCQPQKRFPLENIEPVFIIKGFFRSK